jgi:AcrR family transcriptional regulator
VADRVGTTPANLVYHFGSKEGLLLAVIAERDRRAGPTMEALAGQGRLEAILGLVAFAEQSEREPGLAALHTVLQVESFEPGTPAHGYFRERSRVLRRWSAATLRAAQADGQVRADLDCAAAADEVVAYLEGAAVLWLMNDDVSLVTLYRTHLERFVEAVRA